MLDLRGGEMRSDHIFVNCERLNRYSRRLLFPHAVRQRSSGSGVKEKAHPAILTPRRCGAWHLRVRTLFPEQPQKLVHGQAGGADQRAECAHGEFLVLGNREVGSLAGFREDQVTAHLSHGQPARFAKGLGGLLPGDVAQLSHG